MLGRDLRLPIDLLYVQPEEEPSTNYLENLEKRLEQVHEFVRSNLKLSTEQMKGVYNVATEGSLLEKGDSVWLFNPIGLSPGRDLTS